MTGGHGDPLAHVAGEIRGPALAQHNIAFPAGPPHFPTIDRPAAANSASIQPGLGPEGVPVRPRGPYDEEASAFNIMEAVQTFQQQQQHQAIVQQLAAVRQPSQPHEIPGLGLTRNNFGPIARPSEIGVGVWTINERSLQWLLLGAADQSPFTAIDMGTPRAASGAQSP